MFAASLKQKVNIITMYAGTEESKMLKLEGQKIIFIHR